MLSKFGQRGAGITLTVLMDVFHAVLDLRHLHSGQTHMCMNVYESSAAVHVGRRCLNKSLYVLHDDL